MKHGWGSANLGDLCEVVGGGTPPKDTPAYYSGTIPWATVRDMRQDVVTKTEFRITRAAVRSSSTNIIPSGNVIIATRVGLGKVCLLGQDTAINQDLRGIIPRDNQILTVRFLFWWLKAIADVIVAEGTGATVQGVKLPFIKSLQIPVPPRPEQERIVGILDEAFDRIAAIRTNTEKNLRNARAVFESRLNALFAKPGKGWIDTTIGQAVRFIDYRGKTPPKTASGIRLITAKNVKMGFVQETPMEYIAVATYHEWMTRGIPRKGDVLFTTEAPLANVAQLDTDAKVAFAQRIIIMQPERAALDSTFLKFLLLSEPIQQRIRAKGTGATVQGIKAKLLKTIEISFPPTIREQKETVILLDRLNHDTQRLATLYQQKLDALKALQHSLLAAAFAGKL